MSTKSNIGWTDATWNPVTGCSKVSAGCRNCYAEALTERFGRQKFSDVVLHPERLEQPLHWRKPSRVFVNSMSDLFHEQVLDEFLDQVFAVMALAHEHTFQVLTKRPERMRAYLSDYEDNLCRWADALPPGYPCGAADIEGAAYPLPNVWLGVSVENQETADERIPILLQTPTAVRFLSVEPLLEPINLSAWIDWPDRSIAWVIIGGESGPQRRECNVEWIRDLVWQCRCAAVRVFVKQDSALRPGQQGRIPNEYWQVKEFPK